MFGFFDYNRSGKGVAKNAPEKRAFFKFMEIFGAKFWKLICLNFIYILFCIPIVTIGPATAALTHVMRKFVLEQPIFVFSEFMDGFRKNFKQSFFVGIIEIVLTVLITYTIIHYLGVMAADSSFLNILLFAISVSTALFALMMHFYIYPQIVALSLRIPNIIKNSFLLAVIGMKRTLIALLITIVLGGVMACFFPVSMIFMPIVPSAWLCFCNVFICYPVIQKMIIIPHYAASGERNPEIPDYKLEDTDETEALFEDFGGREAAIKGVKNKNNKNKTVIKGKVIK